MRRCCHRSRPDLRWKTVPVVAAWETWANHSLQLQSIPLGHPWVLAASDKAVCHFNDDDGDDDGVIEPADKVEVVSFVLEPRPCWIPVSPCSHTLLLTPGHNEFVSPPRRRLQEQREEAIGSPFYCTHLCHTNNSINIVIICWGWRRERITLRIAHKHAQTSTPDDRGPTNAARPPWISDWSQVSAALLPDFVPIHLQHVSHVFFLALKDIFPAWRKHSTQFEWPPLDHGCVFSGSPAAVLFFSFLQPRLRRDTTEPGCKLPRSVLSLSNSGDCDYCRHLPVWKRTGRWLEAQFHAAMPLRDNPFLCSPNGNHHSQKMMMMLLEQVLLLMTGCDFIKDAFSQIGCLNTTNYWHDWQMNTEHIHRRSLIMATTRHLLSSVILSIGGSH